jgi:hypothetical protein
VYVRTLKAGSEFFYRNFTETAGWIPMSYSDIDWNYQTVFSYIMDPIQRRHKGISEIIISSGTRELFLSRTGNFHNIIKLVPFLDAHSASLHDIYGDKINKINWLLMTNDHQVAIQQTNQLLEKHSLPGIEWNVNFTHNTGSYMSEIFTRVKTLWESTEEPQKDFTVDNYFQADIELYNRITQQYLQRSSGSNNSYR